LISIFLGMCKTRRDIEVALQEEMKKDKKMRDTMKALHTQAGCQPPRSPISPSPLEVEIASVDDRVNAFLNPDLYNQYGSNIGSDTGASSSSAPPPPPPTGFDSMFQDDTVIPPPWAPPPSNDDWAAHVSHEFFHQLATSYGMENSLLSPWVSGAKSSTGTADGIALPSASAPVNKRTTGLVIPRGEGLIRRTREGGVNGSR
jgi:hypothetical protein